MGAEAIYTTKPFDAITSLVMVYQLSVTSECLMIYMNQSMLLHPSNTHTTQQKEHFLLLSLTLSFFSVQQQGAALHVKQMVESSHIIDLNINCSTCWECWWMSHGRVGGNDLLSHRLPPRAPHTAPKLFCFSQLRQLSEHQAGWRLFSFFLSCSPGPMWHFCPVTGRHGRKWESLTWRCATFRPSHRVHCDYCKDSDSNLQESALSCHGAHSFRHMNRWANYFHRSGVFQNRNISGLMLFPLVQKEK